MKSNKRTVSIEPWYLKKEYFNVSTRLKERCLFSPKTSLIILMLISLIFGLSSITFIPFILIENSSLYILIIALIYPLLGFAFLRKISFLFYSRYMQKKMLTFGNMCTGVFFGILLLPILSEIIFFINKMDYVNNISILTAWAVQFPYFIILIYFIPISIFFIRQRYGLDIIVFILLTWLFIAMCGYALNFSLEQSSERGIYVNIDSGMSIFFFMLFYSSIFYYLYKIIITIPNREYYRLIKKIKEQPPIVYGSPVVSKIASDQINVSEDDKISWIYEKSYFDLKRKNIVPCIYSPINTLDLLIIYSLIITVIFLIGSTGFLFISEICILPVPLFFLLYGFLGILALRKFSFLFICKRFKGKLTIWALIGTSFIILYIALLVIYSIIYYNSVMGFLFLFYVPLIHLYYCYIIWRTNQKIAVLLMALVIGTISSIYLIVPGLKYTDNSGFTIENFYFATVVNVASSLFNTAFALYLRYIICRIPDLQYIKIINFIKISK